MYCGKKVPRPIPLFIEWTEKKLTTRQEAEMKEANGFGCGRVLNAVDLTPQIVEPVGCRRDPTPEIDLKKLVNLEHYLLCYLDFNDYIVLCIWFKI